MKLLRTLLLILAVVSASASAATISTNLPDPVRFGAVMELGDVAQVRAWLDAGLDPNFVADRIGTGLMIAAWTGNIALMELFVERGADIHRANAFGETALLHAAWRGQTEAVKWLLARGAKANREGAEWSALHYAAFAGHGEASQLLLERGADLNARSPNGSTPLMMAIHEGHEEMASYLIKRGADRKVRNERGDTALDWAVKYNRTAIAKLIGSADELAAAAAQAKNAPVPHSQWEPDSVEELLRIRRLLEARGMSLNVIDQRINALRARLAAQGGAQKRTPVLEITARRRAPAQQGMRLIFR
ncbi:ankyrin repeat domain-containing protein [Sulfurisoma sediminicola]|uniref:Uncharacterized protein n=1 Tax=Sulfurisoma sediminicola TaxID=1381557 RepID=A0A497XML2_9PROT|nr:ankyrin repeat domain-containing protein [Sulfurisoma sediminicola]RLJ68486.1 hypothetical protein DFR35_1048 [Sulfurisoma sediminicola]